MTRPVVTVGLIVVSTWVFFFVQAGGFDLAALYGYATVPCELTTGHPLDRVEIERMMCIAEPLGTAPFPDKSIPFSVIASIFLHGSLFHLFSNMLSLWIFGDNVEDAMGKVTYLGFYLVAGIVATLSHVALNPASALPLVGASGAIAGVMGVYLVIFPGATVDTLIPPFFFASFPAFVFLLFWFVGQFFLVGADTGIAWEAHVGGFLFGIAVGLAFRQPMMRRLERLRFPFGSSLPPPVPLRRLR